MILDRVTFFVILSLQFARILLYDDRPGNVIATIALWIVAGVMFWRVIHAAHMHGFDAGWKARALHDSLTRKASRVERVK